MEVTGRYFNFCGITNYRPWIELPWFIELLYSPIFLQGILWVIYWFAVPVEYLIIPYFISLGAIWLTNILIFIEVLLALYLSMRLKPPHLENVDSEKQTPLTIVIPAYLPNEFKIIEDTVRHIIALPDYITIHPIIIIIFNCGVQSDHTSLIERLTELGAICIYSSTSHSKAENINLALTTIQTEYIFILDADHRPHNGSLNRALSLISNDSKSHAIQGLCLIDVKRHDSFLSKIVSVEFAELYGINHYGGRKFHNYGIFGGSNCIWRTSTLLDLKLDPEMLTEDIDISFRCLERGYRIDFDPYIISEEEAPRSMISLYRQRLRWSQGWSQVALYHTLKVIFNMKTTLYQKVMTLLFLVWRELFYYLSLHCLPAGLIKIIKTETIDYVFYILLVITIITLIFPIVKLLALSYILRDVGGLPPLRHSVYYILCIIPYELFKISIAHIGHLRILLGSKRWTVTKRE